MAGKPVAMLITAPAIVEDTNLSTRFAVMGIPSTSPLRTPRNSPPTATTPPPKPGPTRLEHQYSLRSTQGTKHPYQAQTIGIITGQNGTTHTHKHIKKPRKNPATSDTKTRKPPATCRILHYSQRLEKLPSPLLHSPPFYRRFPIQVSGKGSP